MMRAKMSDREMRDAKCAQDHASLGFLGSCLAPERAVREAEALLGETQRGLCAVPLCWPNWPGAIREDERLALAEGLRGFCEMEGLS